MNVRVLSGNGQPINGLPLSTILNTIKTKAPAVSHAILFAAIPSFRVVANGIFRANVLGLATLMQFLFDKKPEQKSLFINRWYALGGEKDGRTITDSIYRGSQKKGLLNITKVLDKIRQAQSINPQTPIGCTKCNGNCKNPGSGATGAEEATAGATILAIVDFLTQAIAMWKQYMPDDNGDEPNDEPNGDDNGGNSKPPKKDDNTMLILGGLGLLAVGYFAMQKN